MTSQPTMCGGRRTHSQRAHALHSDAWRSADPGHSRRAAIVRAWSGHNVKPRECLPTPEQSAAKPCSPWSEACGHARHNEPCGHARSRMIMLRSAAPWHAPCRSSLCCRASTACANGGQAGPRSARPPTTSHTRSSSGAGATLGASWSCDLQGSAPAGAGPRCPGCRRPSSQLLVRDST